ncbi:hypothetical protein F4806DRAFT_502379 [Annulohypoxylon nitens]|nr:hypothetical protein F4806DRAFT_502379 [Annulohypoxylon nitens]
MAELVQDNNLWARARDLLADKEKEKLKMILDAPQSQAQSITPEGSDPSKPVPWPEKLRKLCEDRKDEYKEKQWKIKFKGKERALHDLWDKAISMLGKLNDAGIIATSTEPMVNLGWSIAQLFIQIPIQKADVARSVAEGLSLVLIIMSRGLVYENALQNSWKTRDEHNIQLFENFIVELYKNSLRFLIAASDHYGGGLKGNMKRTWTSVWDPMAILSFDRDTTKIQRDLQDEQTNMFIIGVQGVLCHLLEPDGVLESRLNELTQAQYEILNRQKLQMDCEEKKRERYERYHRSERIEYKDWYQSQEQHILWIHGIRGAGKTKLISRLVDEFDVRLCKDSAEEQDHAWQDLKVAFFYCAEYDNTRTSCVNILRSIIKQLAEPCDILPEKILEMYDKKSPKDAASRQMNIEDCQAMLDDTIRHYNNVLLILDALDECNEDSIKKLLSVFDRVTRESRSNSRIKVIVSSRDLPEITNRLRHGDHIVVSEMDNKNDIVQFIKRRLSMEKPSKIPPELREKIVATLSTKSRAMFQYAAVHLENILQLPTASDIEDTLESPPKDIVEVYRNTINIIKSDPYWGPYVMRALSWIRACGGRSPHEHLIVAASQKPEQTDRILRSVVDLDELLKASRFLLNIENGFVHFSHLSVQDYFIDEDEGARNIMPMVFLGTLLNYNSSTETKPREVTCLYNDANEQWWRYVVPLQGKKGIQPLLHQLLDLNPEQPNRPPWQWSLEKWTTAMFFTGYLFTKSEEKDLAETTFLESSSRRVQVRWTRWCDSPHGLNSPIFGSFATKSFQRLKLTILTPSNLNDWKVIRLLDLEDLSYDMSQQDQGHSQGTNVPRSVSAAVSSTRQQTTGDTDIIEKDKGKTQPLSLYWLLMSFALKMVTWIFHVIQSSIGWRLCANYDSTMGIEIDNEVSNRSAKELWQMHHMFIHTVTAARTVWTSALEDITILFKCRPNLSNEYFEELRRVIMINITYNLEKNCSLVRYERYRKQMSEKFDFCRPLAYRYFFLENYKCKRSLLLRQKLFMEFAPLYTLFFEYYAPLITSIEMYSDNNGGELMEARLDYDAYVNQRAHLGDYRTTLHIIDIVKYSLNMHNTTISLIAQHGRYGTALINIGACANKPAYIVKRLLEEGTDPSICTQIGVYCSASAAAFDTGEPSIVGQLLNADSQIDDDMKWHLCRMLFKFLKLLRTSPRSRAFAPTRGLFAGLVINRVGLRSPRGLRFFGSRENLVMELNFALRFVRFNRNRSRISCKLEYAIEILLDLCRCMGDRHAARLMLLCLGYVKQDAGKVESWRQVLSECKSGRYDCDWKVLGDCLQHIIPEKETRKSYRRMKAWAHG